jgi:hypothetical protein
MRAFPPKTCELSPGTSVALHPGVNEGSSTFAADHWRVRLHTWARRYAIVAAVLMLVALTIDMRRPATPVVPVAEAIAPLITPPAAAARFQRPNYRHSVIAGGAFTRDELAAAMREDAVVAAHYRRVDTDRIREAVTAQPRTAYVSYRIGHRVYWTRNPVRIPAGEAVLTDGVTEIRARCGNGISESPRQPVSDQEPPTDELDNVEGDSSTAGERTLPNTAPVGVAFVPFFQLAQKSALDGNAAADVPEEIRPVGSAPQALLAYLIDPAGSASNDRNSLFDFTEPSARGDQSSDTVNGGRPFLAGVSGLSGGPIGGGSNGDGSNGEGSNGDGSNGDGSNGGGSNGGGSNGGGSNGGGSNGGGSNGGGSNGGGSTGGGSNGGGSNGGGSNGGGSNGGGSNGGGSNGDASNGGGSNGGGSNGGGSNGGGSTGGGSNGGGWNGGGSNGGGSNGGNDGGGGQDPEGTLPTTYPGSEDLIEADDEIPAVPEPGALMLLGLGLAAAAIRRRR